VNIEVSDGEMLDKLSILCIKRDKITDKSKLVNIEKEHKYLVNLFIGFLGSLDKSTKHKIEDLYKSLKLVNTKLWDIEDKIRTKECRQVFDKEFVDLARRVYMENDLRARIKKSINTITGSKLIEEKSYAKY